MQNAGELLARLMDQGPPAQVVECCQLSCASATSASGTMATCKSRQVRHGGRATYLPGLLVAFGSLCSHFQKLDYNVQGSFTGRSSSRLGLLPPAQSPNTYEREPAQRKQDGSTAAAPHLQQVGGRGR